MTAPGQSSEAALAAGTLERRLPPVAEIAVASIALVLASGIFLAAHLPGKPPLTVPTVLVAAAGVLSLADIGLLSHIRPFAWASFFLVARWALLAYFVIAGLLLFVFVHDQTRGAPLVILSLSLLVFAIDVPTILAFTVAKYQVVDA